MPNLDRRGFLNLLGAASVTPLLPALPARAVAARAPLSASKALWAGIYGKSGSVPEFLKVARGMGLSNSAIQGVSARSIGVKVAVAAAQPVTGLATRTAPATRESDPIKHVKRVVRELDKLADDALVDGDGACNETTETPPPD